MPTGPRLQPISFFQRLDRPPLDFPNEKISDMVLSPKTPAFRVQQHGPAVPVIERLFLAIRHAVALRASAGGRVARFVWGTRSHRTHRSHRLVARLRFSPVSPMSPTCLVPRSIFERVSRRVPVTGRRLPCKDEAGKARSGKVPDKASKTYVRNELLKTLKPGDIVVLDNLGSHKGKAVRNMIRNAGAHLMFLPPYSPDLNPIEQVFAKIKHLMRRAMERTVEAAQDRLVSVLDTIPPSECANYFSGAGYAAT
jgi:transposase